MSTHPRPSDVGFCVVDGNADAIASALVRRLDEDAYELESLVNRLYRGRECYTLPDAERLLLDKFMSRCAYMAKTAGEILEAQQPAIMQAAE